MTPTVTVVDRNQLKRLDCHATEGHPMCRYNSMSRFVDVYNSMFGLLFRSFIFILGRYCCVLSLSHCIGLTATHCVHSPGACRQLYYLTDTNPHISSVRYSPGRGKSAARVKHCGTAYPAGARSASRRGSARPAAQHHNTSLQTWARPHVLTRASDLLTPPSTWGRPHV